MANTYSKYICNEHNYFIFKKNESPESVKTKGKKKAVKNDSVYFPSYDYPPKDNVIYYDPQSFFLGTEKDTFIPQIEYDSDNKSYCYYVNPESGRDKKAFFTSEKIRVCSKEENEVSESEETDVKFSEENSGEYKDVYCASYLIGAQWIHEKGTKGRDRAPYALVIAPKVKNIDYSEMFMTCLQSGIESEEFSKMYGVDFEAKEGNIFAPSVASALDPLLFAHFVSMIEKLLKRGLKKDYIYRSDNLKKPKGRIDIQKNERKNVIAKRYDRVYCNYSEYSIDIPENRVIKRALIFVKKTLSLEGASQSSNTILLKVRKALSEMEGVSDQIQVSEIKKVKSNKLYREYPETVRLAKMILKRYGYSLTNITNDTKEVPPFWIDMAGLFEHYTLVMLKKQFGERILYQCDKDIKNKPFEFHWRPDFLLKQGDQENQIPMILDAKYKPALKKDKPKPDDVRELSGYSRMMQVQEIIGVKKDTPYTIPCVLLYPIDSKDDNDNSQKSLGEILTKEGLKESGCRIDGLEEFYAIPVSIPMLNITANA